MSLFWVNGTAQAQSLDYGDYSLFPSASSTRVSTIRIGATTDAESSSTTNASATGDDITGSDDEDGVTLPSSLVAGNSNSLVVNVTNTSGSTAYLNVWIDFNRNGSITDSGEQVASNLTVSNGTSNSNRTITFTVPSTASLGSAGVRVRLTSVSSPGVGGTDGNGEVEDHLVTISNNDYGDWNGSGAATVTTSSIVNSRLRLGASVDAEAAATTNAAATGDDLTGTDDEDGITLPASVLPGTSSSLTARVTNTRGSTSYLNAWIDFNGNGSFGDSGEQIASNVTVANKTSNSNRTINFSVPANAASGTVGVRVRLTSTTNPGATGASGFGEVEDHLLTIACPTMTLSPATLPAGTAGAGYSASLSVSGGRAPHSYAATTGALPAGLSLNSTTGALSGVPTAGNGAGSSLTVTATDANGCSTSRVYNLIVCPVISLNPASLPAGMVSSAYSQTVSASGGAAPYAYAVSSGSLPAGLVLNASSGVVSGRPTSTTAASFTVSATDANGCTASRAYSISPATPIDFGDFDGFASASSTVNSTLRIGALTDAEPAAVTNGSGTGDDAADLDDEDGVTIPAYINAGFPSSVVVNVTNTSGSSAFLNVWIDFNGNGSLGDSGEQVASNTLIASGSSNSNRTINFTVPAAAKLGMIGVRARLTSVSSPGPTGVDGNGEVEDTVTNVILPADFGDFSKFGPANSVASSTIRMGALVDNEVTPAANTAATGDDLSGSDDEDGVTLPASVIQGQVGATVTVQVTNTSGAEAYLNGWIDFNDNGDLSDAGEQIVFNDPVATGSSGVSRSYTFNVPTSAVAGSVGVRFRLTSTPTPGAVGLAGTGEVEDHLLTILATSDYGDYAGFSDASSLISDLLKMGALVDSEFSSNANLAATGDDTTNVNDEDGVSAQAILVQGQAGVSVTVHLTNKTGAPAYLNGWVDFNRNDSLANNEQIIADVIVPDGTEGDYQTFFFDVPSNASLGAVGMRFRLTSVVSPGATGADGIGEVEDYTTTIVAPSSNFRDYFYTIRQSGTRFYLDEISVYNPNSSSPTVSVNQGILDLNVASPGFNTGATDAIMNGLALDWLNRRFYWAATSAGSGGYNFKIYTANYDNVSKTWNYQQVTGSTLSNVPYNTGTPISASAGAGAFPRAAYYAGGYYAGGQHSKNVALWNLDSSGLALGSPAIRDYPDFFHQSTTFNGGDFVIRPQDGLLVTSTVISSSNTLFNQFIADGINPSGPAATTANINSQIPFSSNSSVQIAGVGGVTRLYALGSQGNTLFRIDNYDTTSPNSVRVGPLPEASYTDLSEGISSSVTSLGVKGVVYDDANGLADNTVNGTGTNAGGSLFAMLVDSTGKLVDSFPVKSDGTFILGGATANKNYTVVLSTTFGSLGSTAPPAALPQGWVNSGEFFGNGTGNDGSVDGVLSVSIGTSGVVNAKFGIVQGLSLGNLVWNDANNNGLRDAGENGIVGVTVQLWSPGGDEVIGGNGPAADVLLGTTTTDSTGAYNFTNLTAGKYFVRVTPVTVFASASSAVSGDNGVDNDNNGSQPGGSATAVFSPVIDLARGMEPGNLASGGGNTDNTIDFGLFTSTDYGDFAGFGSAGSAVAGSLYLGTLADAEDMPQTDANAAADDLHGSDDEDGVTVPASITPGSNGSISAMVTNTSGSSAFLNAWIDFNQNGVLTDAGEHIARNILISNGALQSTRTLTFLVPADAPFGVCGVRVRLSSVNTPGPTGSVGRGEVEDYVTTVALPTRDFGDDLDFADASSMMNPALHIGASVDMEGASTRTANADGDDTAGSDDEDGVTFPSFTAGQPVALPVTVTNNTGATAYLNAWIDFNNNGDLTDLGEQIAANIPVPNLSSNRSVVLNFDVPSDAVTAPASLGTRFRLTDVQEPGPTGHAGMGEVEDHPVIILAPLTDFGDFSGVPEASNTASSNLRLGALVDTEYASSANADATGDDMTGVDDEDGVTLPSFTAGAPATIITTVTNSTGAAAYLNAWIDFNNNGVFTDPGEQIASNTLIAAGTSNASRNINVVVPAQAVTGTPVGVRVRLSALPSPGSTGAGSAGEVEDYVTVIAPPTTDFGDLSLFADASSTVVSGLRLGALVDTEYSPTKNASATGDDITGVDDEDAVTFPTLIAGALATIPVTVTNTTGAPAYLNAWIDFNNNGSINDAGEQIATNIVVAAGAANAIQNIVVTIPAATLTGINLGSRFRLTSVQDPGSAGAAGNGEVEDHIAVVNAPTTDYGDFSGFTSASQGVNPALRMGAQLDAEFAATLNADATGDDETGIDDEDGVDLPEMTAGETVSIPVTITNVTGGDGYLNAWFDFNNNGVLTDSGEQIAANIAIPTGTIDGVTVLNVTIPANAVTDVGTGVRFRLSAPSGLGPTGANPLAGEIEDYTAVIGEPTTDFGDHALLAAASSTADAELTLGMTVDTEFAATTNANATGDDNTGTDDEDGVLMPGSLQPGTVVTLPVTVRNITGGAAYLHAWIDFNNDGVLDDAVLSNGGERLENARLITSQGRGTILREYWLGISGTSVANLTGHASYPDSPTGSDLRTQFSAPTDWADNMGQRMRGWIYPPVSGEYTFWVSGDDETQLYLGSDATPGSASLVARVPSWSSFLEWTKFPEQKSVKITLEAGRPYYIEALMKEGGGGDNLAAAWELPGTATGPVVIDGQYLAPWTAVGLPPSDTNQQIVFTVPVTSIPGSNRAVRFRLTTDPATGPVGHSGTGEVEDYAVTITAPTNDFGDWSGAASASNGVSTDLFLGEFVDAEYVSAGNASATGDDLQGIDDEDGVMLPPLTAGGIFNAPVVVTNSTGAAAFLNAWIDFNNNGSFADAGEQIITNQTVVNGSDGLALYPSITVPTNAVTGANVGVRLRLTSNSNPGPTGAGTGIGEVEDYVVNIAAATLDQGDNSRFATAASTASASLRLGALVDAEYTAATNAAATGDDTNGLDDEDGVTFPTMTAGGPGTVQVKVTNATGATAFLNVWIDFNNNGLLSDAGEQVASNVLVAAGTVDGTLNVNFTVPATGVTTLPVGVRVRLTSVSSPGFAGTAGTGEVEDHLVNISPPPLDFGDWSGLADAASTVTPGLRLGTLADTEFASTRNSTASGDDNTELDDEDGVTFTAMTAGAPASISVNVTNTTASPAYLNAWFDFNNNNSDADAGEQIATNILVAPGTSNATITLNLTIPANAVTGATLGTRFRLTNLASPGITGTVGLGEVEDHPATISVPLTDYGDWSRAFDAWNLASSDLRMGALADTEYAPTKNATATGDDITGSDDEDGVTMPVMLPGTVGSASVVVTNNTGAPGYLNAWIDYNDNGLFDDPGEQIAINILVSNGSNGVVREITFNIPVNAVPGVRGTRFRLTSEADPGSFGGGGTGEIEDHMAVLSCVPFSIHPAVLPAATVGTAWSQALSTTGIHAPIIFNVSGGSLPVGLSLDSASGLISGTPTSDAPASFTITATDFFGCTATRDYALTPACPVITISGSLPQDTVGTAYSRTLTASGGTAPYHSWSIVSGSLPQGLSLNSSSGVISGTPTAAASPPPSITVSVTDTHGCKATRAFDLHICPVVTVTTAGLPVPTVGTPYSTAINASGGDAPYVFSIASGSLPPGLGLDTATGVISGTPTSATSRTFSIRATDAHGCSGARDYSLAPVCPVIMLTPGVLPPAFLGTPYDTVLAASGGTAPYTYSIVSGSLPPGISMSSAGVFSGMPTTTGAVSIALRATDSLGCSRSFNLTIQMRGLSIGNLVFEDSNHNGLHEPSEPGIAGALVQLFNPGADNSIGGSGADADVQVGEEIITPSSGAYLFAGLPAGRYYIKVTPPPDYLETGGTPATLDDDVNGNNDGSQPEGPGTPLFSPIIELTGGGESVQDGDEDPDTNLSIDFGLWSSVAVGNFIFLDINGDGVRNEGESLGDIFVELYAEGAVPGVDEPVSVGSSGCSCKGRYYIEGLNPGSYFLHIPAAQFAAGMALEGLLPMSVVVPGDDDLGQDLMYNSNPAVNGASTAVFSLRPGLCPVGSAESGGEGTLDDEIDARVDLTRDLGLVAPAGSGFASGERARRWLVTDETSGSVQTNANTFATWRQDNGLGGPNDDADEDGVSNLLEYAFGTDPFSPLQPNRFSLTHDSAAGVVARITQPLAKRDDLIVRLETLTDLALAADPAAWKPVNMAASTTFNGDDTFTRHYSGLERLLVFNGRDIGFIRLKVSLDADRNGVPEASSATPAHAWSRQTFSAGMRTFSMPLLKPSVFTGRVNSVLANEVMLSAIPTLPAASLYLEALDGALLGQRFEIDSALSSGNTLVLHEDGRAHHGLGGARVAIRAHHMLAEALPPASFNAEDRVLVFDTASNNFTPLVQGENAWSDGVLSMNMRPFAPHEAVLVDVRGESTSLWLTGEVRSDDFILPLVSGAQLIGSGWAAPRSAPVTGLRSGITSDTADRLRLWNGDESSELTGYNGYYLDNSSNPPSWLPQDATVAPLPLLPPFHGFFFIREEPLLLPFAVPW